MVLRLILLLAVAGALTVFTLQNLTPLLPLVFFGIQFPALPLSWWVLGAIAAGGASMIVIQILIGLSNFVTGQTVRSRVRAKANREDPYRGLTDPPEPPASSTSKRQPRRERSAVGDSAWQDWRGYESASTQSTPPRTDSGSVDDWERPPSEDWETPSPQRTSRSPSPQEQVSPPRESSPRDFQVGADRTPPPRRSAPSDEPNYRDRTPQDSSASSKPKEVVDADFRVIVPPYRPLEEPIPYTPPPPPPPVVEENADDWFEESSDDFGEPNPAPKSS